MQGFSEHVQYRAFVTSLNGGVLSFYGGESNGPGQFKDDGSTAPIIQANLSRKIGEVGRFVFAIPQRSAGPLGLKWSWVLRANDPVEFEVTVQRSGNSTNAAISHPWRNVFFGFIADVEEAEAWVGDSLQQVTLITCVDQLGILAQNHFTYWRKLGESLDGKLAGDAIQKLKILDNTQFGQKGIESVSIAQTARVLLESFIYSRIIFKRKVRGRGEVEFRNMHSYRLESDDFATNTRIEMIAPESSSWLQSLQAITDAPAFSELFMDSMTPTEGATPSPSTTIDTPGIVNTESIYIKKDGIQTTGGFNEVLCLRPVPFPHYIERLGYSGEVWGNLPKIYAIPELGIIEQKLARSASHLFSVFSVNVYSFIEVDNAASQADLYSQLVADGTKLISLVGYRPMDVPTRRTPMIDANRAGLSMPEMGRRLAWQLASWHQLNDLFLNGEITVPVDLRARLGVRYVTDDNMFYIDGYSHDFGPDKPPSTTYLVTRGLPVEMYGDKPRYRKVRPEWDKYVEKYIGRQRPGEEYPPVEGRMALELGETQVTP